jgi:N-acetylneuraminic acid mutarotase
LGNLLYRIGGGSISAGGDFTTADVDLYNSALDRWNTPANPADYPWPVSWPCAGAIDGKVYVAGGFTMLSGSGGVLTKTAVYDPASNTWDDAAMADLPDNLSLGGSADLVLDKRLVCAGGIQNQAVSGNVWAYDPKTDQWIQGSGLTEARFRFEGDTLNGRAYTLGGWPVAANSPNPFWNATAVLESTLPPNRTFLPIVIGVESP